MATPHAHHRTLKEWMTGRTCQLTPPRPACTEPLQVDERTQMQLYWPPFEGAARAGVLSYMCADNLVSR